jgi:hypothetical protein
MPIKETSGISTAILKQQLSSYSRSRTALACGTQYFDPQFNEAEALFGDIAGRTGLLLLVTSIPNWVQTKPQNTRGTKQ